jgi:hypothetical protein
MFMNSPDWNPPDLEIAPARRADNISGARFLTS